jgi:pimeloyl-ACP methyl ester carboxylesterase
MKEKRVLIPTRSGEKLETLIRIPDGDVKSPAVIFVSGLGTNLHEWRNSNDEIALRLIEQGFITIQFDFSIFKLDGTCRELPLSARGHELEDVYTWVSKQKEVEKSHIGVHATSYGVPTALTAHIPAVKAFVFVSGAYSPYESIKGVYTGRGVVINFAGETILPRSNGDRTIVAPEFWRDAQAFDVVDRGQHLKQPVFVIHGDADTKMSTKEVQIAFNSFSSLHKRLKIFIGGDHGINEVPTAMREEFLHDIVTWYKATL